MATEMQTVLGSLSISGSKRLSDQIEDMIELLSNIVIKSEATARANESIRSKMLYDIYTTALLEYDEDTAYNIDLQDEALQISIGEIRYEILKTIAYTDLDYSHVGMSASEVLDYKNHKYDLVSDRKREALLVNKRKKIISDYVEENNYYRMLNGEPPLYAFEDDSVMVIPRVKDLLTLPSYEKFRIYMGVINEGELPYDWVGSEYIFKLPDYKLQSLRIFGEDIDLLSELAEAYDSKYIQYLDRKTNYIDARTASAYDIVYYPALNDSNNLLISVFEEMYQQERNVFVRTYENDFYTQTNKYYIEAMAFILLTTAMFRTMKKLSSSLNVNESISEYDMERILLSAGLPYVLNVDKDLKINLTHHLNTLLRHRGDKTCLVMLEDIFNVGEIFKLMLYKKPESLRGSSGTDITKDDLVFIKTAITARNIVEDRFDEDKYLEYAKVTSGDNTWTDDQLIKDAHNAKMFSFVNTKYIGINNMINVTKFTAEISYFFRSVWDHKNKFHFKVGFIGYSKPVDLFDLVNYAVALICIRYGYTGEIPDSMDNMGAVIGFNSPPEMQEYRDTMINKYGYGKMAQYKYEDAYATLSSFTTDLKNDFDIATDLREKLYDESDVDRWNEINNILDAITTTDYIKANFKIGTTTTQARTYQDMVLSSPLATRYSKITHSTKATVSARRDDMAESVDNELNLIISTLKSNIKVLGDSSSLLSPAVLRLRISFLKKMLTFFSSYRVQLMDKDISYTLITNDFGDKNNESRVYLLDKISISRIYDGYDRVYIEEKLNMNVSIPFNDRTYIDDGQYSLFTYDVRPWHNSLPSSLANTDIDDAIKNNQANRIYGETLEPVYPSIDDVSTTFTLHPYFIDVTVTTTVPHEYLNDIVTTVVIKTLYGDIVDSGTVTSSIFRSKELINNGSYYAEVFLQYKYLDETITIKRVDNVIHTINDMTMKLIN